MNATLVSGKINENNISSLIRKLNYVFRVKGKHLQNHHFTIKIEEDDFTPIAALVIYKIFSFALDNNSLLKPSLNIKEVAELFSKYELHDLISSYFYKKDRDTIYASIRPKVIDGFFIAPHAISKHIYKNTDQLNYKYYEAISNYYSDLPENIIDCIKTCIVEISSNFYYHTTDKKSILMSHGSKKFIEIITVDTSEGIIETLRHAVSVKNEREILMKAFDRRVSSKKDKKHCGTGLWLVSEIVKKFNGKLIVHTGDQIYRNINGNVSILASNFWQGTILFVRLPLSRELDLSDFMEYLFSDQTKYI